tara:strand:+ start:603 stop:1052 length:450 start_codon:yes stop_codon:yes gene_type:complete
MGSKEECRTIDQKIQFLEERYEKVRKKIITNDFKYEDQFQAKMFFLLSGLEIWHKDLFTWSVPNGDFRQMSVAKRLKATGVRAGVSDLMVMGNGMIAFIENKRIGGRVSDAQKRFEAKCQLNRMAYKVYDNSREVQDIVKEIIGFMYGS